jgi:Domain of unknown function (DUF4266)
MLRAATLAAALVASLSAPGCTAVHAYERETLAQPRMQLDPDPEATLLEQHVYTYREGSSGGYGGGGGGCGCN